MPIYTLCRSNHYRSNPPRPRLVYQMLLWHFSPSQPAEWRSRCLRSIYHESISILSPWYSVIVYKILIDIVKSNGQWSLWGREGSGVCHVQQGKLVEEDIITATSGYHFIAQILFWRGKSNKRVAYQLVKLRCDSSIWLCGRSSIIWVSRLWWSSRHSRLPHRRDRYETEQLHSGRPVWGENSKPVLSAYNLLLLSVFNIARFYCKKSLVL